MLAERNVASAVAAEDARTARDLADVALRDARRAQADGVIEAPFDGLVAERVAAPFTTVAPGEPILRLHDMSEVRVEIEVAERALARAGTLDAIAFTAPGPDGAPAPLRLAEFQAQTGPVGQSFRVSLALPDALAHGLVPGASMAVMAVLPGGEPGAALPPGAILGNAGRGFEVMVFRPKGEDEGRGAR